MIELPDNHCYLVIRVSDKASGDKSTSIVACYNQLSRANARASDEMSAAFTHHPLSNEANKPRARLVEDKYFAFAEFASPNSMRGDRIEVKVKKLPVQQGLPNASTETTTMNSPKKRGWSRQGVELEKDEKTRAKEIKSFAATIPKTAPRMSEASILATRRRVESEINEVPVEGYLSKYEYYRPRQQDIDALLSSTNTANTFLGATLRFYQSKRMEANAAAVVAMAASRVQQSPVSTPLVSPLTDHEMRDQPTDGGMSSLLSPLHEKEDSPESPISPLSLNDKTSFEFRPSLEDIERLLTDPCFETGLSRSLTISPPPTSGAKAAQLSAVPLTPPASRRASEGTDLKTEQHTQPPRENRFLRPRTASSPRKSRVSSPRRNRSRRIRPSRSPVSPKLDWTRDLKTRANTQVNRGKGPARRVKRRPRASLDISSLESHILIPHVVETQLQPMKNHGPILHESRFKSYATSRYCTGVRPQGRRQRPVDDPETPSDLHAAKVAKTLDTANRRGSSTTLHQNRFSLGSLTESLAGLSAQSPSLSRGKTGKARTRGTISKFHGGRNGTRPITHIL